MSAPGYVLLEDGDAFTYANWTKALKRGRTSLASGPYQFLELKVEGQDTLPADTHVVANCVTEVTSN